MAHVLGMPALEIRHPVALGVLVESGDPARHGIASRRIRPQPRGLRRYRYQSSARLQAIAGAPLGVTAPS